MRFSKMPLVLRLLVGLWVCVPAWAEAQVQLGNEVLAAHHFQELAGKRVGLLANPSGVNRQLLSTIDVLHAAPGVKLVALFGAEHGIDGKALAGKEISNSVDARTGLPVYSFTGRANSQADDRDAQGNRRLVYDIRTPDVVPTLTSARWVWPWRRALKTVSSLWFWTAKSSGRPAREGPRLNPKFRSLVGQWNILMSTG